MHAKHFNVLEIIKNFTLVNSLANYMNMQISKRRRSDNRRSFLL